MIQVTRLNGKPMILNADLIEHVESTPDTIIHLSNGRKYLVTEGIDQIRQLVVDYHRECQLPADWVRK